MSATLLDFAQVNDAAAATTKKLQKQHALAEYFRSLDEVDLPLAIRFAAGRAFPASTERVLNVGGAIVGDVVFPIVQVESATFWDGVRRAGELGEALSTLWPARPQGEEPTLTLRDIAIAFDGLANTGNQQRKRDLLGELYAKCLAPREAAYLTKIIFGDLRTGVQEGVLIAAIGEAFNQLLPDLRQAQLFVGDLDAVALLARSGALATARFTLFHPIQFMLATSQETPEIAEKTMDGRMFWAEDKLDGIRAQIHKEDDRIGIYTRTMDRTDASFPDIVKAVAALPGSFLIDGEIVPWRGGCVLPFVHIQKRLGRKTLTAKMLRDNPLAFIAFDVLYRDGVALMDRPLQERRAVLDQLIPRTLHACDVTDESVNPVLTTTRIEANSAPDITRAFDAARARRNEGIVLKDPQSAYSPGRRGQMWLKLKTHLPTLDCVVTAAEYGHGKRRNALSDYTFAVWDRDASDPEAQLVNVGKAYSGVTDEEIAQLTELFLGISRGQHGHVHVVEPKVVLEIAADQVQKSLRHASGYALRFPRIKRIRWDKGPRDADTISRVIEVYESGHNFGRTQGGEVTIAEPTLFDHLST